LCPTVGPFRTAKFSPLQAAARGVALKKSAPAYIHGRQLWRVSQLPGLPIPHKVQIFRGGVAFDDCVLLPFPFSAALMAWFIGQTVSWANASRNEEERERLLLLLEAIDTTCRRFWDQNNASGEPAG
jgi:hypothetical protein